MSRKARISCKRMRIGDLGRLVTGKTPSTKRPELFGTEYPFITPSEMKEGERHAEPVRFLSEEGARNQKNLMLPPNAVAFVCIASVGKACLIKEPSFTNQQVNCIIVDPEVCDSAYVYYLLVAERARIRRLASGTATPIISKSGFAQIEIDIPPLSYQRRSASILSAYDDLIENNARRIAILEEMVRRLYNEWFENARSSGEGWGEISLGSLVTEVRETVGPDEVPRGTPYVGLEHIPRRSITLREWGTSQSIASSKLRFKQGDILFGKIRPYFHKVVVAPIEGICSTDTILLRPIESKYMALALCITSSDPFVDHAAQTANGTKMPRADWKVLNQYPVYLPPKKALLSFNAFVDCVIEQCRNLMLRSANLRTQRDLLLPKLVSGEFDVSDICLPGEEAAAA